MVSDISDIVITRIRTKFEEVNHDCTTKGRNFE